MNAFTNPASTNTILAIDLGKYKSVACIHEQATGEIRVTTLETSRAELRRLIGKEQPAVIIIEACLLAGWVHDLCGELGVRCLVANTASKAWKFKHLKRKTDKDDALRLVQLYLLGQLPTVTLPVAAVRQWRSLIACRQALVGRRVAVQNRIRALFVAQGLPAPRGAKVWAEISGRGRLRAGNQGRPGVGHSGRRNIAAEGAGLTLAPAGLSAMPGGSRETGGAVQGFA
jgi:transposase